MAESNADRISYLASQIVAHRKAYYSGNPTISDQEFDRLEDELRDLAPDHPVLAMVGAPKAAETDKVAHEKPMLSLNKTYDINSLKSWIGGRPIVASLKLDGNSLSLIYENGVLRLGKTRGNGRFGEDVTSKILWVEDIPNSIDWGGKLEIRGELCCSQSGFLQISKTMFELSLERPTSPRNIVAGLLGRKDHLSLARFFSFFAFELVSYDGGPQLSTERDKLAWLEKIGFRLPSHAFITNDEQLSAYCEQAVLAMQDYEYGVDGVVFTYDDLSLHESLGVTSHHPRFKMSFKWQGETAVTEIKEIFWATSRLGIVTPVARVEPVTLSGASISNVTLHNAGVVRAFDLKAGDRIEIVRSGEVIPKFLRVIELSPGTSELPHVCPSCNTPLESDDIRLICPNLEGCPAQLLRGILHWTRSVEIDGLSEKRIEAMIEAGLVRSIPDLYQLSVEDLLRLPLVKQKMATKLHSSIQKSRNAPLVQVLTGLGIQGIGRAGWEEVLTHVSDLHSIRSMTVDQLVTIDGFAQKSAQQIVEGIRAKAELIDALVTLGVGEHAAPEIEKVIAGGPFQGKMFVITGTLSRPRTEIEAMIKGAGGKVTSSVSKQTHAIITDDPASSSSKAKKGRELGVPFLDEEELARLLQ